MRYAFPAALAAVVWSPMGCFAAAHAQVQCDQWNTSEFFSAASAEEVQQCLTAGADTEARDLIGLTPLHLAKTAAVVEALLAAGSDIEARGGLFGLTPLRATLHIPAVAEALLAAGANPNARDIEGGTPLHSSRTATAVNALIAAGADPNARTVHGSTPLYEARSAGVLSALIAAGADPKGRTAIGTTPLHLAALRGDVDAVKILLNAGADVDTRAVHVEALLASPVAQEIVGALVAADFVLGAPILGGLTPLHLAALRGNAHVVEVLLDAGADSKSRTAIAWHAFDYARHGNQLTGTDVYWRLNDAQFD